MLKPERIVVLGSSSLLASAPTLGDPGQPLELSFDADLLVEPCDSNRADVIHEAIGQNSLFHRNYGVYADLMKPNITETFAPGWLKRCVRLEPGVLCLSPVDLAFAKLRLGRNKDVRILRAILAAGVVSLDDVRALYQATDFDEATMFKAGRLLTQLAREFRPGRETGPSSDRPDVVRETGPTYGAPPKKKRKPTRFRVRTHRLGLKPGLQRVRRS